MKIGGRRVVGDAIEVPENDVNDQFRDDKDAEHARSKTM